MKSLWEENRVLDGFGYGSAGMQTNQATLSGTASTIPLKPETTNDANDTYRQKESELNFEILKTEFDKKTNLTLFDVNEEQVDSNAISQTYSPNKEDNEKVENAIYKEHEITNKSDEKV